MRSVTLKPPRSDQRRLACVGLEACISSRGGSDKRIELRFQFMIVAGPAALHQRRCVEALSSAPECFDHADCRAGSRGRSRSARVAEADLLRNSAWRPAWAARYAKKAQRQRVASYRPVEARGFWNRTNQLIQKIGKVADRVSCQASVTISLVSPCSRLVGLYGATALPVKQPRAAGIAALRRHQIASLL